MGKFLSAGVFTREFDLSFRPGIIPAVGAAIVGPTARGRAMVPTQVSSYSDYLRWFGDTFTSGSSDADKTQYKYLTSYAAQEYLRYGEVVTVTRIMAGEYSTARSHVLSYEGSGSQSYDIGDMSFTIHALSDGELTNSGQETAATSGSGLSADETSGGKLVSGSRNNIRWEISGVDLNRGTFDLSIRRGDDFEFRKVIMEEYNGVSLDPNTPNYIARVVGDQTYELKYDSSGEPYLETSGEYANRSRFIRVEVRKKTLNYLLEDGTRRDDTLTGSLPAIDWLVAPSGSSEAGVQSAVSGTFAFGSDGDVAHPRAMYENIVNENTQGFNLSTGVDIGRSAYLDAFDILANKDQYDYDLLFTPGLVDNVTNHSQVITRGIAMCERRGDVFYVIDPTVKGDNVGQAQLAAEARNSNYAAYYYPWLQVADADLGRNVWVPPSALLPSVFSFTDQVADKWFAPAGLMRGGLDAALQAERSMTQNDRDNLYTKNVNPIATYPREGIVVWGQKTLQKKMSALDRINVRRLLIAAKRHVAQQSRWLVFEQNTEITRETFLQRVRPWFENARRKQGLYDFRIIIDDQNNTPDVIDRNEMRAQIYLKPARTAEFIIVDFNILPTGAEFPSDAGE